MIILFEENEKSFSTLGLGVLKDAISCKVKEKLNDEFTLTMEYPVTGAHFSKIKNNRIIYAKPNPYSNPQAFRIYNVTKAINGKVTVDACHISYDANDIPVKAFSATSLQDAIAQIQNGSIIDNPFTLSSDISYSKTFKTTKPYNLRAILMGGDESLTKEYDAELIFDNYVIKLQSKRGENRGGVVKYGHNMTDLNHVISNELCYNGIFPYYHTEKTTTETTTANEFTQAYIVSSKPYTDGWLSYSENGEPYHPVDESPIQIATEGDYYQKVYTWNTLYNRYDERIYNQQVTLIEGVTEPSWLVIDWSKFPKVTCKAARNGYYKKATDTDWGDIKSVGDTIFEGSIVSSGILENIIINFAEVIPSRSSSKNEEVTEVVDVQLDPPILWLDTPEAKSMLHNRVLMVDLTSEFDEEPSLVNLRSKAEEYVNKNKIGTIKHSTTLSFVDLSATTEASRFKNMDHVEIGDTVKVIYEDANIEVELRVITTEYDAILGRYDSIELGEKEDTMSGSSIQNGDNISSLTNDAGYASVSQVSKLIADIVTANYVEALNAKLSTAQINQLSVERIECAGIFEASQFVLDELVAKMLIAENAQISQVLKAGEIQVAGDISINSGQITIYSDETGTSFIVDRNGNLTANSVTITGGSLNINDGIFSVSNDGKLIAQQATITGTIIASSGDIGGFVIDTDKLYSGTPGISGSVLMSPGYSASIPSIAPRTQTWAFLAGDTFGVTAEGHLYARSVTITGDDSVSVSGVLYNYLKTISSPITYSARKVNATTRVRGTGLYMTKIEAPGVWDGITPHDPPTPIDYEQVRWLDPLSDDYFILDCCGLYSDNYLRLCKSREMKDYHSVYPLVYGYASDRAKVILVDGTEYLTTTKQVISGLQIDHYSYDYLNDSESPVTRYIGSDSITQLVEAGAACYSDRQSAEMGGARIILAFHGYGVNTNQSYDMQNSSTYLILSNSARSYKDEPSENYQILLHADRGTVLKYERENGTENVINLANNGIFIDDHTSYSIVSKLFSTYYMHWETGNTFSLSSANSGSIFVRTGVVLIPAKSYAEVPLGNIYANYKFVSLTANALTAMTTTSSGNDIYGRGENFIVSTYDNGVIYYKVNVTSSNYSAYHYYYKDSTNPVHFSIDSNSYYTPGREYYVSSNTPTLPLTVEIYSDSIDPDLPPRIFNPNNMDIYATYILCICDEKRS